MICRSASTSAGAGNPHFKSDSEISTSVATKAGDCLIVAVAMFPEVAKVPARHTMNAHLQCVVA